MSDNETTIILCGTRCKCECPDGPCEHDWSGPEREFADVSGSEATCAKCGMGAMHHSLLTSR